jgi:uncharacterized membrane protein
MNAIAYTILQKKIIKFEGSESVLKTVIKDDKKGKFSLLCYAIAIPLAFVSTLISGILFIIVALIWIVPDKRIEKLLDF